MRIAIVGSGITGLGAAYALSEDHEVTVFEKQKRFGGHADTQVVTMEGREIAVDTGFIVYNQRNYPNLCSLFEHLDVPTKWSDMSFGVSVADGKVEYACESLDKLFAQRGNVVRPQYWQMLLDIKKFNAIAEAQLDSGALSGLSLGDWAQQQGFSNAFIDWFVLPMGGAIWSTPVSKMMAFPAESYVTFFRNHDLMTGLGPMQRWRTVDGGSREYVQRLLAKTKARIVEGAEVVAIERSGGSPDLIFADGARQTFDQVIVATHGPQTYEMLSDMADDERAILGAFKTAPNTAVLHSDPSLMPKRRKVWSSWNFITSGTGEDADRPAPVSYWMNRLQSLTSPKPLIVSLNPRKAPDPALVHGSFDYAHPLYDADAFRAQEDMDAIQGRGGVWYAGAWLGYGFHEDGLRTGLRVARALGSRPAWAKDTGAPFVNDLMKAAE